MRKALYNSLRMNWLTDPSLAVTPWQVEDYREKPVETLFERLSEHGIVLNRQSFLAFAEKCDTPEELSEMLLPDSESEPEVEDQIYLIVFELWRRLIPEKQCLSIFCDELDQQITFYERGELEHLEALEDSIANLQDILDENTDYGTDPATAFESVESNCAHDLAGFLYDFIDEQIENDNEDYAQDLLDGFKSYVDSTWFQLLEAKLLAAHDVDKTNHILKSILRKEPDIELNFEILNFLVRTGDPHLFLSTVKQTMPLIDLEEDFHDLLELCAEYYIRLDQDEKANAIQAISKKRAHIASEEAFSQNDPDLETLTKLLR